MLRFGCTYVCSASRYQESSNSAVSHLLTGWRLPKELQEVNNSPAAVPLVCWLLYDDWRACFADVILLAFSPFLLLLLIY